MTHSPVVLERLYPDDTVQPPVSPVVFVVHRHPLPSLCFLSCLASESVARRLGILSDFPVDTRVPEQVILISVYYHHEISNGHLVKTMVLVPENLDLVLCHETEICSSLVRSVVGHRVTWIYHELVNHLLSAIDHALVCHRASVSGHASVDLVLPASSVLAYQDRHILASVPVVVEGQVIGCHSEQVQYSLVQPGS